MRISRLHSWDLSPAGARAVQDALRTRVAVRRGIDRIATVAGADVSFSGDRAFAAVVVYRLLPPIRFVGSLSAFPDRAGMEEIERACADARIDFPYVPGLLSFREGPALLRAFGLLRSSPDAAIFDGQGIAHPRGFGLASHMGLLLSIPSVGCAKSRLFGSAGWPAPERGSVADIEHPATGGRIGAVVRTRDRVRPVFVSPGHLMDIRSAVALVLVCSDGFRLPRPVREADRLSREMARAARDGGIASRMGRPT